MHGFMTDLASAREGLIDWLDLISLTRQRFTERRAERRRVRAAIRILKARWAEDMERE